MCVGGGGGEGVCVCVGGGVTPFSHKCASTVHALFKTWVDWQVIMIIFDRIKLVIQ